MNDEAERILQRMFERNIQTDLPDGSSRLDPRSEFDAICDFVFNEGEGALLQSNLLKNLNAGFPVIEDNFVSWDEDHKTGGLDVDPVLLARRQKEYALFLTA